MATHSGFLAWRIPGMVEPGGLPSIGSCRVRHDWSDLAAAAAGIPSPPLALFIVMLPKAHLTSHSRMSGSTPLSLSGSLRSFLYSSSVYSCHLLISSASVRSLPFYPLFCPSLYEFSRQEYWDRLPFPSPGSLPNPGFNPASPALACRFLTTEPPEMPFLWLYIKIFWI